MMQKLNNQLKMISEITHNREWRLKYSFLNRKCYFSGQSLRLCMCYLGRKKIHNIISKHDNNDDIWISQKEYLNLIKNRTV